MRLPGSCAGSCRHPNVRRTGAPAHPTRTAVYSVVQRLFREQQRTTASAIDQSRSRHRPKYEAQGLVTRARAGTQACRPLGGEGRTRGGGRRPASGRSGSPSRLSDRAARHPGSDALLDEARRTAEKLVRAVSTKHCDRRSWRQLATRRPVFWMTSFDAVALDGPRYGFRQSSTVTRLSAMYHSRWAIEDVAGVHGRSNSAWCARA